VQGTAKNGVGQRGFFMTSEILGIPAKYLAMLPLAAMLAACQTDDAGSSMSFSSDSNANQPYPSNYRAETISFLHTYLNNPVGVHEAAIAEPVQRTVGGHLRYVGCLRYSERQSDGAYREVRDRAVLFVNGRLDRMIANAGDECAGAVYAPFPELEKMQR
jgi:hypothetical protein